MFDRDSSSVARSLIGIFAFRSNPVAWSTGSLRKNSKIHCCWGVNNRSILRNLLMKQTRIEHAPKGSLLTYITSADPLVNKVIVDLKS